jgi:hypothetical protein
MPGKEGLRAQRRSAGCNSDGAARAWVGVPTMGGGPCAAPSPGATADHIVALGGAGPMGRQHRSHTANRVDPLMMRAGGTPDTHRAQPDQIFRDRNSFPAEPAGYSLPKKRPLPL